MHHGCTAVQAVVMVTMQGLDRKLAFLDNRY